MAAMCLPLEPMIKIRSNLITSFPSCRDGESIKMMLPLRVIELNRFFKGISISQSPAILVLWNGEREKATDTLWHCRDQASVWFSWGLCTMSLIQIDLFDSKSDKGLTVQPTTETFINLYLWWWLWRWNYLLLPLQLQLSVPLQLFMAYKSLLLWGPDDLMPEPSSHMKDKFKPFSF